MKYYFQKTLFVVYLSLLASIGTAQSGVVYSFTFKVDEQLTEYYKEENKSRKGLPGFGISYTMPAELLDLMKSNVEQSFTAKFNLPVKLCYHINKNGKEVTGGGPMGYLEGLPSNTFNGGKEDCPGNSHYIRLDVVISPGGTVVIEGCGNKKLKPQVTISAKVIDENKKEIWDKKITIKNLGSLRSQTCYRGNTEVTRSETLTPYDIHAIYMIGMEELMAE